MLRAESISNHAVYTTDMKCMQLTLLIVELINDDTNTNNTNATNLILYRITNEDKQ